MGVRKPADLIYQIACERLRIVTDEAVFIDDLPENVEAAERLGMHGIVMRGDPWEVVEQLTRLCRNPDSEGMSIVGQ